MRELRLALIGFGHVGRAFARLLLQKQFALASRLRISAQVTAIVTASHGWAVDEAGLPLAALLERETLPETGGPPALASLPADVLVEVTSLNPKDGQPALDHMRQALQAGMHVVTANKGPIAHGYRELADLATRSRRELRFEATVADTMPVFNLARYALPAAEIRSLRGVVNSTTNYLLSEVARGQTLAAALGNAQALGIAERDPVNDLEGWDAALKAVILAAVLMHRDLRVSDVLRRPVTEGVVAVARAAAIDGRRVRAVLNIDDAGATWQPVPLLPGDPLFAVDGFSMGLEIDTDAAGRLFVALLDPHVEQTAFALLSDLVDVVRTERSVEDGGS